ncbi:MAG: hypothetical protein ACK41Z_11995 [Sediminibacterium sp.]
MKRAILLFLMANIMSYSYANNISIQKVAITDTNKTAKTAAIRFNISWENSWRDAINWDAAWIFVKFRRPQDSVWRYKHMTMSASGNNTGTGTATMKFAIPDDRKGAFYYRSGIGSGNIKMDSVKLVWNYGADSVSVIDSVEVKVFATEMVYVPQGNYSLGDGNGKEKSQYSFQIKSAPYNFVTITDKWSPLVNIMVNINDGGSDDATLYKDGIRISGLEGLDINNDKVADLPDFPTGYRAFYCMKYPVTQGQYADMLNTLSLRDSTLPSWMQSNDTTRLKKINPKYKAALQNLDPFYYNLPNDLQRHTISLDSTEAKYFVSRPDRAFGRGQTNYYESYSDWAALRPMSEMEYEKAARGPLPPMYKAPKQGNFFPSVSDTTSNWSGFDWAWGNDTTLARESNMYGNNAFSTLSFSGNENGTESFSNYNVFKRYINPIGNAGAMMNGSTSGGDGGSGPFRVGIFATDTSSRISSGATYYGIMDFSKNVAQYSVSAGSTRSRTFSYKKNGDGILNYQGQPDQNEFFVQSNNGPMIGGGTLYISKQREVSNRQTFSNFTGFRSVRTAPAD